MSIEFANAVCQVLVSRFSDPEDLRAIRNAVVAVTENFDIRERETTVALPCADQNLDLIQKFMVELHVNGRSKQTIYMYQHYTRKFLETMNKSALSITCDDVLLYFAKLQQRASISSRTVLNICHFIRPFFNWLIENEYIARNPFCKLHLKVTEPQKKVVLTDSEIKSIKANLKTKSDKALIGFLSSTGLRVQECHNLNKSDLDLSAGTATVFAPKTRTWRTVFLTPQVVKDIQSYIDDRKDESPALFVGKGHLRMSNFCIEKHVHKAAERAGIQKHVTVHTFRKSLATSLHAKGMNDLDIATILGHASPQTTVKYYIKNDLGKLQKNFEKLMSA